MPRSRLSKIAAVLALAACAFLATVSNITDHSSNFEFVKHGLSMDTSFEGNAAMYRAITNPALRAAGCWSIIAGEAVTGLMPLIGGWRMIRHHHATAEDFDRAKGLAIAGAIVGFISSAFWCGSSGSSRWAANGSRCGNSRCGTVRRRRSGFTGPSLPC